MINPREALQVAGMTGHDLDQALELVHHLTTHTTLTTIEAATIVHFTWSTDRLTASTLNTLRNAGLDLDVDRSAVREGRLTFPDLHSIIVRSDK